MGIRIVCVDPNAVAGNPREIAATGQLVHYGEEVEVEDADLAGAAPSGDDPGSGLLAQPGVWARPTTNAAKDARKAAARRPAPETEPSEPAAPVTPEENA